MNLEGMLYPSFTSRDKRYTDEDKLCIQNTVERLLAVQTSAERPGMLLGKIQSGKTKTFLGVIALAFDNGFDVAIILTKGTKALARQTLKRVYRDFVGFHNEDLLQIFDIMSVPAPLTPYELNQKIIFVAKKQSDNLDRLITLFSSTYRQLATRRVLIIDDEADYASVGFRRTKEEGIVINTTAQQIHTLRGVLHASAFLQVTATPYSLYLQPNDILVSGVEFKPVRPAFTQLVPVHPAYVGSDYYFDQSQERGSVAAYVYEPLTNDELGILRQSDRRRFRVEDVLTSDKVNTLRRAICNFIVGGCIRRLQDARADLPVQKYSFLVHTEAQRAAHAWQEQVVTTMRDRLTAAATGDVQLLQALLVAAYDEISPSVRALDAVLPSCDDVLREALGALQRGWLMITKVNSEQQVEELLDDEGQLKLRTPLNIFIGGQILDRGITVANLIGFFYGRRPQIYQQDTVLQHSRMFGFRPIEDLSVTRFYTEPRIHDAMRRMHESDVALRQTIDADPDAAVVFIRRDDGGRVVPCSPNKILISNTTTLRPFKRILPAGFQTDYAVRVRPVVEEIDRLLSQFNPAADFDQPFEISAGTALDLLQRIEPTLEMMVDEGYDFDWGAARAALTYLANVSPDPAERGRVWCLVRQDRNLSRRVSAGSHATYADAPDTTRTEGDVARAVAIERPMLMMIRQNGREEQGWRGTPFYWPVLVAQKNTPTSIFAHETAP